VNINGDNLNKNTNDDKKKIVPVSLNFWDRLTIRQNKLNNDG